MNPIRYLQLGLVVAVLAVGGYLTWNYRHMTREIATANERIARAEADRAALQRNYETLSEEVISRAEIEALIRESRQSITIRLDEVQNEDPVARDYLGERIPDSVRGAYLGDEAER